MSTTGVPSMAGSGGCNRLSGSYELSGDRLTFGQMAGTMMACIDGMETEKAFPGALGQAKKWRIAGQRLELFDAAGKSVARFETGPPVSATAR
jgi:heat shock protein HslJ